jgi:hypothetical protein
MQQELGAVALKVLRKQWNKTLLSLKQTHKHENGGNVRFIKRHYEILYKEKSQWHDTFGNACNYMHVDFD